MHGLRIGAQGQGPASLATCVHCARFLPCAIIRECRYGYSDVIHVDTHNTRIQRALKANRYGSGPRAYSNAQAVSSIPTCVTQGPAGTIAFKKLHQTNVYSILVRTIMNVR